MYTCTVAQLKVIITARVSAAMRAFTLLLTDVTHLQALNIWQGDKFVHVLNTKTTDNDCMVMLPFSKLGFSFISSVVSGKSL